MADHEPNRRVAYSPLFLDLVRLGRGHDVLEAVMAGGGYVHLPDGRVVRVQVGITTAEKEGGRE